MDVLDLRVFEAVARLGSMNRAAAELHTVQSNVTARIRALEDELGCRLFERQARGTSLTAAGQALLPYAHRMAALLADAKRAVRDDGPPSGELILGALESTAALRLSPVLAAFAAAHPKVDLALRTGTSCELIASVLERRVEGAFVCGPVSHPDLEQHVFFREELAVLAAPGVRSLAELLRAGEVRLVVLRAGCSYRQRLDSVLAARGIRTARLMEFGTLEAILACVGAGLGITLLPRALVGATGPAGRVSVHRLPSADAQAETLFIRRRDAYATRALRAFLDCARANLPVAEAA